MNRQKKSEGCGIRVEDMLWMEGAPAMKETSQTCEICESEIEGKPFSLSSLDGTSRTLRVCAVCAAGPNVTIYHAGIEVSVPRDEFLQSDKERLYYAIESTCCGLEDLGWKLESIGLSGCSDQINEPLDIE